MGENAVARVLMGGSATARESVGVASSPGSECEFFGDFIGVERERERERERTERAKSE